MFWKLTLPRGVFQIAVTVAITWLVVAKLLLPYTNLSFSSFQSTYEDVALDFLGSPKAYIILLTTAWLAAYGNLVYGWDYNGIMVPSLLALTWFAPGSLLRSIIEALILMQLTKWVLRAPVIRHFNVEGPRKLATVFLVGFLFKFAAGWMLHVWFPSVRLTDYFGFGYVLTSLLAVKMLTIKKIGRVLFPSVAVSLVGFLLGSGIGLALHILFPDATRESAAPPQVARAVAEQPWAHSHSALTAIAARTRYIEPPLPRLQQTQLVGLWTSVDRWLAHSASLRAHAQNVKSATQAVLQQASRLQMQVVMSDDGKSLAIVEAGEAIASHHGFESLVLWPGRSGPVLVVGRAASQRGLIDVAYSLCTSLLCRAVMVGGYDEGSVVGQGASGRLIANVARQAFAGASVLVVEMATSKPSADSGVAELYVQETLGAEVNLGALRQVLSAAQAGDVVLHWRAPPAGAARVTRAGGRGFATLLVPEAAAYRLGCAQSSSAQADGTLVSWLHVLPGLLDPQVPLACKEMLAQQLGMATTVLANGYGLNESAMVFSGAGPRRWFTVVVPAASIRAQVAFTATRGALEQGTDRIASILAFRNHAPLLVVHNVGSDDLSQSADDSAWFAAHIALSRSLAVASQAGGRAGPRDGANARMVGAGPPIWSEPSERWGAGPPIWSEPSERLGAGPALVVDVRGFAAVRGLPGDVYLAAGNPVFDVSTLSAGLRELGDPAHSPLGHLALGAQWVDGSKMLLGLQGNGMPQVNYRRWFGGADAVTVWFSSDIRTSFSTTGNDRSFVAACALVSSLCSRAPVPWLSAQSSAAFGLSTGNGAWPWAMGAVGAAAQKRLHEMVTVYQSTQDPAILRVLVREFSGFVVLGFDQETRNLFLAVRHGSRTTVHFVHRSGTSCHLASSQDWSAASVAQCSVVVIDPVVEAAPKGRPP
jgi:gamma-polyglutamate biosynthesis protein CapC